MANVMNNNPGNHRSSSTNSGGGNGLAQSYKDYKQKMSATTNEVSRKDWRDYKTENGIGGNADSFMSEGAGSYIANGINAISPAFTQMNTETNTNSLGIRDSISSAAINSGIPIAMAIGAAAKGLDAISDATGLRVDDMDKTAAEKAGVSGGARFLNNAMNALPGNTMLMWGLSKLTGTKPTENALALNESGEQMRSGYGGITSEIDAANNESGKTHLFGIGHNKLNRFIEATNQKTKLINSIGEINTLAKKSDYGINLAQQNINRYAGTNYNSMAVGKQGMKIPSRQELQRILALRDQVKELKKGGVVGIDTNLIPEGALHARLNHLQEGDLEDTTRKGIPVLDSEGRQIAEIEHSEIIFRLELTKKVEELMKDGSDEAMIEAGKIITKELITNTQDNSGITTKEDENG